MLREAQDFLDESTALHALIAPLSAQALRRRTAFKGWTIEGVIGHLHTWNHAALLSLRDPVAFGDFYAGVRPYSQSGNLPEFEKQWLDGLSGPKLVAAWALFCDEMAAAFGDADPKARVAWAGPSMSVRSAITARLMETWAHGQEIYDILGKIRTNADRIRGIVVLGVNTFEWTFRNRGEEPPGPLPHLRLTAPSGDLWTFGEDSAEERIEGLAEEFCQVVTQTRNIRDTRLTVTGPVATAWMAKAQCFAGPAVDPPAPGTRKIVEG